MDEQLIQTFVSELRLGFGQVVDRLDQTNLRLDQTNQRLDQTILRLDQTNIRLDQNIAQVEQTNIRLDQTIANAEQTNIRLDQTIIRLDRLDMNIELLRAESREKFDGIGIYLQSINGHILDHAKAISKLEKRVTDIEETD